MKFLLIIVFNFVIEKKCTVMQLCFNIIELSDTCHVK